MIPKPPTYPARPINGGKLELARPKRGEWYAEPKFNGWRTLVHRQSGAMFNRQLEPLSIHKEFEQALYALRFALPWAEWVDCEGLERRHGIGKGSLIVLDFVSPVPYSDRRRASHGSLASPAALRLAQRKQPSPCVQLARCRSRLHRSARHQP